MAYNCVNNDNACELERVSKKYRISSSGAFRSRGAIGARHDTAAEIHALREISLSIARGAVTGIIGRNASGKSTLLNLIAGTSKPSEGLIRLNGKALGLFNLGVGFQDEMTGRQNIYLNAAILGASRSLADSKLQAIIDFSELGVSIDLPLGSYSQGMRLRLGFSIIANLDFDILALDEVLAVGDVLFQSKCYERLMDFRREGRTLVITTQDLALIERLCDRVVVLDRGRVVHDSGACEAVSFYRTLLSKTFFSPGPDSFTGGAVETTKKNADDISSWGTRKGSREVSIEKVSFTGKWGTAVKAVSSGARLKVKAELNVRNDVKDPHFGVAFFRGDGVYCYGPNTSFDGFTVRSLRKGRACFVLDIPGFILAPGRYVVSVAVWDKDETLAFDYHDGCYSLEVRGGGASEAVLARIPYKLRINRGIKPSGEGGLRANAVSFGAVPGIFRTCDPVAIRVWPAAAGNDKKRGLSLSILRDDGVLCQGISIPGGSAREIFFPKLPLLPGGYLIRLADGESVVEFPMRVIWNRADHGTVFLDHSWHLKGG